MFRQSAKGGVFRVFLIPICRKLIAMSPARKLQMEPGDPEQENVSAATRKMRMLRSLVCGNKYEKAARAQGATLVAGVDEVGRGSLFGCVVAAAVILPENTRIRGLRDSKQRLGVAQPADAGVFGQNAGRRHNASKKRSAAHLVYSRDECGALGARSFLVFVAADKRAQHAHFSGSGRDIFLLRVTGFHLELPRRRHRYEFTAYRNEENSENPAFCGLTKHLPRKRRLSGAPRQPAILV